MKLKLSDKIFRHTTLAVLFVISTVTSLIMPSSTAGASSAYDDLIRKTDSLVLKSSSTDSGENITDSWYQKIQDTTSSSCTSTYKNSLTSAITSGEYGISMYTGDVGLSSDSNTYNYAFVYWTDGTDGYNQFAGTSPDDYIQNVPGASLHREALIYIRDDDTILAPVHIDCTYNTFTLIGTRPTGTTSFPYSAEMYYSSFNTMLPVGYAGPEINIPITGSAICGWGNTIITNIFIDADTGVDGEAQIVDNTTGGKNYNYNLSEPSDYRVYVHCSGMVASSSTVASTNLTLQNWACTYDTQGGIYICESI